ncbi:hypothetical protein [Sporichthya polymorpha]|uniref:hypothetical protein n=1 Tax=Sporichthya polymorpha TaxID=35751 RepID=UPI00036858B4|nr:hypothetical protein [Sporichthya polymorpha]
MANAPTPKPGEPGFIGPMLTPPGHTATPFDVVQVSTSELRDYLSAVLIPLEEAAGRLVGDFRGAPIEEDLFGPIPEAQNLARVHRAAHEIYDATLLGLQADITGLVEKLRACIDAYDCRDADVEADLIRISQGYVGASGSGFRSETAYQQAVAAAQASPAPPPPAPPPTQPDPERVAPPPPATGRPGF